MTAWRARYRRCTALLLDDVHLIAGKERTQEELFLLFNLFLESNRQLGFTSAVPLAELSGVEQRLLTRLEGGLVVELPPPDRELRQQLVERTLAARGQEADAELVDVPRVAPRRVGARRRRASCSGCCTPPTRSRRSPSAALAREVLEGGAARRAAAQRAGPLDQRRRPRRRAACKSREKMVWDWPDARRPPHRGVALMAIKGILKEASLPDVIQLLSLGRKTGCLAIADRQNFGYIYFDDGQDRLRLDRQPARPAGRHPGAQRPDHRRTSSRQAVDRQASDREQQARRDPGGAGRAHRGRSSTSYMRLQIEEAVYYLFTWTTGTFNFEAGVRPEREDFLVSINPESLLLEGARRVDEWSLIEKKIPSFDLIFAVDQARLRGGGRPAVESRSS